MPGYGIPDLIVRESPDLRDVVINDGDFKYSYRYNQHEDKVRGYQAVYIDCSGSGKLTLSYETDPGREDGQNDIEDWYVPSYRNPIVTQVDTGKLAIPVSVVIGVFLRFKLEASGGSITINSFKLDAL